MKKPLPSPRRKPTQSRSRVLVDAVIRACQQILQEEGARQLTTSRIAEVAGVTIGSLYQYFPNKEAIIASLFSETIAAESDQFARTATARVMRRIDSSLGETIRELIEVTAELHLRYYNLHGDFYREYYDFLDFRVEIDRHVTEQLGQPSWEHWIPQLLTRYQSEIQVEDLELAALFCVRTIDSLLGAALERNPHWLSDAAYIGEVERVTMAYLTAPPTRKD